MSHSSNNKLKEERKKMPDGKKKYRSYNLKPTKLGKHIIKKMKRQK